MSARNSTVASIGVLGGAFNPPHLGHLVLAVEAADQLALDRVLLVPTGVAPHREIQPEPGGEVRLELVELACAGDEALEPCALEVRGEGPSFTCRTLEQLTESRPDDELMLLMGADVAASLPGWRRPERILELARIGVAARPGTALEKVEEALAAIGAAGGWERVRMPGIGISSTEVRDRVRDGRSLRHLVPEAVIDAIARRGLYA